MAGAEKTGTERRNKRRKIYHRVTWVVGGTAILAAAIWLPSGPLQTYVAEKGKPKEIASVAAQKTLAVAKVVLRMSPGELTGKIAVPPGMRVVARGDDFRWHLEYADGTKVTYLQSETRPADGSKSMPFVSFENIRKDAEGKGLPNAVVYHFE